MTLKVVAGYPILFFEKCEEVHNFVFQFVMLVYVLQFLDGVPSVEDEFLLAKFATDSCEVRARPFFHL